jgi:hypothetical protein
MTQAPRVEIVIDQLVFRGLSAADARAAAAALEDRLAALAAAAAAPPPARDEPLVRPQPTTVPAGPPGTLGEAAAGIVWRAVSGSGTPRGAEQ